jgi:hypothetical protein
MKGMGEKEIGFGNPLAINQLIAHHSVIFQPEKLIAWVSTNPWQLGSMEAYDLKRVFSLNADSITGDSHINAKESSIPADQFLYSEDFRKYIDYLKLTAELRSFTSQGKDIPDGFEEKYINSNPHLYLAFSNLADHFYESGEFGTAADYYEKSLSLAVAGNNRRRELERMLEKAKQKSHAGKNN